MSELAEDVANRGLPTDEESVVMSTTETDHGLNENVISKIYDENTELWNRINENTRKIEKLEWENSQLGAELDDEMELRTILSKDNEKLKRRVKNRENITYITNIALLLIFAVTSFW